MNRAQLILIDPASVLSKMNVDSICASLTAAFSDPNNGFTTAERESAFISQLCVESWHFTRNEENLNYSAQSLLRVFPSHFDANTAAQYEHQPENIANRIYANRMGNGDEASGDGWKYRGRGFLQITGKYMYGLYNRYSVGALLNPDVMLTVDGSVNSAVWFYVHYHNLNILADKEDIQSITKIINGGLNDLAARSFYYNKAKAVLKA